MTGGKCWYCGVSLRDSNSSSGDSRGLNLDHVIPLSKGGPTEEWNLVPACRRCNSTKRDHSEETLRKRLSWWSVNCQPFTAEQETWLLANGIELPQPPPFEFWYERDARRASDESMCRDAEEVE